MAQDLEKLQAELNEAVAFHQMGQVDEAEKRYLRLLQKAPDIPVIHNNLGLVLLAQKRVDEAIERLSQALKLDPQYPDACSNLGNAYRHAGRFEESIASFKQALEINPGFVQALGNLGNTYLDVGRLEDSEKAYRDGLKLIPEQPDLYYNLGRALYEQARWDDAEVAYRKTLSLNHNYPLAHWNLSHVMLLHGRFQEGWAEYEWRWQCPGFTTRVPNFDQPKWDGSDISGKTILVYAEQGFGDTMQFARYLPVLKSAGARVVFLCQAELGRLMETIDGLDAVVTDVSRLPAFDVHAPLMSLPLLTGMKAESDVPANSPYLRSPAEGAPSIAADADLSIGLVWAGRASHMGEAQRSLELADLEPLTAVPGCRFYALQEGDQGEELARVGMEGSVIDLSANLGDFGDTARIIDSLDLVIGVDTAVVHLAGALHKPVWTLLPHICDWRWMLEREDTPWYPTMRLFRQTVRGDWATVVEQVSRELKKRAG